MKEVLNYESPKPPGGDPDDVYLLRLAVGTGVLSSIGAIWLVWTTIADSWSRLFIVPACFIAALFGSPGIVQASITLIKRESHRALAWWALLLNLAPIALLGSLVLLYWR